MACVVALLHDAGRQASCDAGAIDSNGLGSQDRGTGGPGGPKRGHGGVGGGGGYLGVGVVSWGGGGWLWGKGGEDGLSVVKGVSTTASSSS